MIVDRNLFTWLYIAQRDKQNVIVNDFHEGIWRTGMIDVMSAVAALAAV